MSERHPDDITVARNYRDGCVWVTVGNRPRRCVTPEKAREMARVIEGFDDYDLAGDIDDPADIAAGLRQAADDVEVTSKTEPDGGGDDDDG